MPYKIGILFNNANEKNFLFDDLDYYYKTNTLKGQLFYKLGNTFGLNFDLVLQPQIQFIKHQLLNKHFVQPEYGANYLEKRIEFTQLKSIHLYALEFGVNIRKRITKKLNIQAQIGLGFSIIDTETERLAKGFTFIENGSLGLEYKTSTKTSIYIGSNIGHVSNFDFQEPNSGYNILGYEIGFRYVLK